MSVQLQATKRRIKSVTATRKITKAMELIAVTKLQKWQRHLLSSSKFSGNLQDIFENILVKYEDVETPYFKENAEATGDLHLVLTSSLGLCGSYNNNLLQYAIPHLKEEDEVVIIGTRGYNQLKHHNLKLNTEFVDSGEQLCYNEIKEIGRFITSRYRLKKDRRVYIHYSKFVNSFVSEPTTLQLLPLQNNFEKDDYLDIDLLPIVEPDVEEFFETFIPFYINSLLLQVFVAAQVSEQSARRTAMDTATKNADELLDELTIQYNTARQAAITQEITEVIGGAN
ncbi:MAG: ATP synthase F1 subunit gamma [Bacilli bacterium]|jgi:F-type H+-transporting ATPase subunit gamma